MVCQECAKKSDKLITPEFNHKDASKSLSSSTSERKVNQNMMLNKRKFAFDPLNSKCMICKGRTENKNKYCLTCAYTKGICELCGKKIVDTKLFRFTDVDPKDAKRKKKMSEKTKKIAEKKHSKSDENNKITNKNVKKKKEEIKSIIKLDKLEPEIAKDIIDFNDNLSDNNATENDEYDEIMII